VGELGEIGTLVLIRRRCDENLLELYGGEVVKTALLLRERCAPFGDEFLGGGVHLGEGLIVYVARLINFIVVEMYCEVLNLRTPRYARLFLNYEHFTLFPKIPKLRTGVLNFGI